MALVTGIEILDKANKKGYAVGAFNFVNMEMLQAIITAAEAENAPVILQTTQGAIKYAGLDYLYNMASLAAKKANIPVAIHLDHGTDLNIIKKCIDIGYSSIMIDASCKDFNTNIETTREVVRLCRQKKVSIEAEIGTLAGVEDNISVENQCAKFTEPLQAKEFAEKTGIDYMAIAIGTSHGIHKFKGETKLNYDILAEIKKLTQMPLVLHGASGIPKEIIDEAIKYGADFEHAAGVDDESIKRAVAGGINKINVDSDIRLCFTQKIREVLFNQKKVFDIREILGPSRDAAIELIRHKIRIFGSSRQGLN